MRKAGFLIVSFLAALILLSYSNALWNDNLTIKSSINTGQWLLGNNLPEVSQDGLPNSSLTMEPAVLDTADPSATSEKPAATYPHENNTVSDIVETEEFDFQKSDLLKDVASVDDPAAGAEEPALDELQEEEPTYDIIGTTDGENLDNGFIEEEETAEESNFPGDTADRTKDEMGDEMERDPLDDADESEGPILEDSETNNENGEGVK